MRIYYTQQNEINVPDCSLSYLNGRRMLPVNGINKKRNVCKLKINSRPWCVYAREDIWMLRPWSAKNYVFTKHCANNRVFLFIFIKEFS